MANWIPVLHGGTSSPAMCLELRKALTMSNPKMKVFLPDGKAVTVIVQRRRKGHSIFWYKGEKFSNGDQAMVWATDVLEYTEANRNRFRRIAELGAIKSMIQKHISAIENEMDRVHL